MFTLCEDLMITGIQIGIMCGKDADILWFYACMNSGRSSFST